MPYSVMISELLNMFDKIDRKELMNYLKDNEPEMYSEMVNAINKKEGRCSSNLLLISS